MHKIIRILLTVILASSLAFMTACQEPAQNSSTNSGESVVASEDASSTPSQDEPTSSSDDSPVSQVEDAKVGMQLEPPAAGEEIAVMTTNMGVIKIRFFPEEAPKTVENFKTHAKDGYYNGLSFHRVMENFMIQGGDPQGTGTGGESIWGAPFEDEFSPYLFNIRGSIAMANTGKNTNGSQFFINQSKPETFAGFDRFQQEYDAYKADPDGVKEQYGANWSMIRDMPLVTDAIKKLYTDNGGNFHLDGFYSVDKKGHTVFAQVFEGMDIVDKIAATPVDERAKPSTAVIMETVSIETN